MIRKCASGCGTTYLKTVGRLAALTTCRKSGKVVEMQIGNDPVDLTKIVMLYERRKTKE
ncbi:MAG TPA: hypothetical protein VK937_08270 [Candidatus Limnocylindria bacterium]|nr:hypothetical protein [Candidatus Limnocylindria bacterium]